MRAAQSWHTAPPGPNPAAGLARDLPQQLLALDERVEGDDRDIYKTSRANELAESVESLPGMGPILGAELLSSVGNL